MSKELKRFGDLVRSLRRAADLSQEDLAELANLHRTYIGAIERGERNITLLNILKIARALRVPPAKLFQHLG